jgi:hypothetical protein
MSDRPNASFVAECFWPGVCDGDVRALDARINACLADGVRYLGSILMRNDEVVLCQFEGTADAVHAAAQKAEVPFERIVEAAHSPWQSPE